MDRGQIAMHLLDIIPERFFSVLASQNRGIYIDALFVILEVYELEMIIKRDDLVVTLIDRLENEIMDIEPEEGDEPGEVNYSSHAHFLIRKLESTGWIETEYVSDSFEEQITLPHYSIKVLKALQGIVDGDDFEEYNSYVYATYSALKTADAERDTFVFNALQGAYRNTRQFTDQLKMLLNNIKRYHQQLSESRQVKDILRQHFDEFKQYVSDKVYHPLKTLDSVPRFKSPILDILKDWITDDELLGMMKDAALQRKAYESAEQAEEGIVNMAGYIIDAYEKIDQLLKQIDRKNSAYTRASVEKMQYLINTDRSIKGKIIDLLKRVSTAAEEEQERLAGEMALIVELFPQGYLSEESLYTRNVSVQKVDTPSLRIQRSESLEEDVQKEMEEFSRQIESSFPDSRVFSYIRKQLRDRKSVNSANLGIEGNDEFIMTILGALKADDRDSFYDISFSEGMVYNSGYRIPQFTITKREDKDV